MALLRATAWPAASDEQAAASLADATTGMVRWWQMHGWVFDGSGQESFRWHFLNGGQVNELRDWCAKNVKDKATVTSLAARRLSERDVLPPSQASERVAELMPR